jgi:hypothetical protein
LKHYNPIAVGGAVVPAGWFSKHSFAKAIGNDSWQ